MVGLYEQAQACTMVLPRLYLLNTVGACYILSQEAPARVRTTAAAGRVLLLIGRRCSWKHGSFQEVHVSTIQGVCWTLIAVQD